MRRLSNKKSGLIGWRFATIEHLEDKKVQAQAQAHGVDSQVDQVGRLTEVTGQVDVAVLELGSNRHISMVVLHCQLDTINIDKVTNNKLWSSACQIRSSFRTFMVFLVNWVAWKFLQTNNGETKF